MNTLIYGLNRALSLIFDWLQGGLGILGDWGELAGWALLLGILAIRVWVRFSNQEGIRRSRERLQGSILAVRLFQNDLRVFLRIQAGILRDAFVYLRRNVRPMLVLAAPMGLCLIQLDGRYGARPLRPGEAALVEVRVADEALMEQDAAVLEGGEGIAVETAGVRGLASREIAWRVRAREPGIHRLTVRAGGRSVEKEVIVGPGRGLLAVARTGGNWLDLLLHPGEPPIEEGSGIAEVRIGYPKRLFGFWGWKGGWMAPFFILFFVWGYALKGLWRVEI